MVTHVSLSPAHFPPLMELPRPKLKRKRGGAGVQWLQYLQAGTEEEGSSFRCSGVLVGGSVLVQDSADIANLLGRGFFGKAIFSRSIPAHVQTQGTYASHTNERYSLGSGFEPPRKRARVSEEEKEGTDSEVSEEASQRRRRRLLLHTQWREEKERGWSIPVELRSGVEGKQDPDTSATRDEEESSRVLGHISGPSSEHPILASADDDVPGREEQAETVTEKSREDEQAPVEDAVYDPEHPEMDPYPVEEPLCLSSEEAFYLVAEAGLLRVLSPTAANSFTAGELWTQLCAYCHRFPFTYSVYRHYRKKGWVPKSGLKFGVDFILYKDGPVFYHSSYAVLVCEEVENVDPVLHAATTSEGVCSASTDEGHSDRTSQLQAGERRGSETETVSEGSISAPTSPKAVTLIPTQPTNQKTAVEATTMSSPAKTSATAETVFQKMATVATETGDSSTPGLWWSDVIAHCRVSESSGKELVVCYVTRPADWDETQLQSPECVERMSVREVLVTRWVPERDR